MSATLTLDNDVFSTLEAEAIRHGETVTDYIILTWGRYSKAEEFSRHAFPPPLERYQNYLFREVAQGGTTPGAAGCVLLCLRRLLADVPDAPLPDMGAAEQQVACAWDRGEHHLELEVFASGDGEWFYCNRTTGVVWEKD